jgi:type I restriction enzyme R subunit
MHKRALSERNICSQLITPDVQKAGWDLMTRMRGGRITVCGRLVSRGQASDANKASGYEQT